MTCEFCSGKTTVTATRKGELKNSIKRFRKCLKCNHIGQTVEIYKSVYDKLENENRTLKRRLDAIKENRNV